MSSSESPARSGNPVLSIIVPVYGVEGYVRQCLESILDTSVAALEVIAVDDSSPDNCGAILDEMAAADSRLRVRHLDRNVGLGQARNIGLDMAAGDYVWFFDSDDHATDGAVRAVLDRLKAARPDVLIVGHERELWDGTRVPNSGGRYFRDPPAPDTFTCAERPSVLRIMMAVWNKVIRREYLLELGPRFSEGYYEDLNVSFPLLMAAERLSLLDRVCYVYRQRRSGGITSSASRRHFDAFDQYERVFAFMDARPGTEPFRGLMFDRVIGHALMILERGDRISPPDRAEFFGRLTDFYRRRRPAGSRVPGGRLKTVKYRLIDRGAYGPYRAAVALVEARRRARTLPQAAVRSARRGGRVGRRLLGRLYYRVQLRMPIEENLVVYAAYWYRGVSCNPAAIYEKAAEIAPHLGGVWVIKPGGPGPVPDGVDHVTPGTLRYWRVMARAKYFVNNVTFPNAVVKRAGQVHVMTQHGTPLKKMGLDQMPFPVGAKGLDFRAQLARADRWDFLVSSNPLSSEAWRRGFPCRYEMLEIGYPRNDRLAVATLDERARLRTRLGVPEGKKAVLYAPTHREYRDGYRPMFDVERFTRELGDQYVLLLRPHYYYPAARNGQHQELVMDVSAHASVEDLCIASDVLLTDYSSIMFDYAVLEDRPIVVLANDWETYRLTRGVNFDVTASPPGVVARTEDELIGAFRTGAPWSDTAAKARDAFRARFCPWDDGHAAQRAVTRVFLGGD
ncbi:bifunctional glycosyltransferase/CDP-glycerol:glycerophosphate glycerophosphotransferase [Actinomadura nitritigenes]|uniref:Bifunctional glycosyltransferase family 2 protein/CDP-glycerol:glycerophosphate glycerophosphotransferase n=1 Tax=Actinomadura nitritigenes TaxID=134602 RepID=A0ABS3R3R5_9ACTN|nr:bifunctional glycosyltransferase family 2 protein/CDP-glycerol:glycerophosphate glycerophosphotransferase [Actinomadura nitritigenes]MBO2440229.1 bifunctional glycosyltransferase family 2 protein/CDP-glycerol:glycerophosphate glycerophosphotransferase [Actinomadura nitritigenes]